MFPASSMTLITILISITTLNTTSLSKVKLNIIVKLQHSRLHFELKIVRFDMSYFWIYLRWESVCWMTLVLSVVVPAWWQHAHSPPVHITHTQTHTTHIHARSITNTHADTHIHKHSSVMEMYSTHYQTHTISLSLIHTHDHSTLQYQTTPTQTFHTSSCFCLIIK